MLRCPNGSRKNKKSGSCQKNITNKIKRSRCPNGSRKNRKTSVCQNIDTRTFKRPTGPSKQESMSSNNSRVQDPDKTLLEVLESRKNPAKTWRTFLDTESHVTITDINKSAFQPKLDQDEKTLIKKQLDGRLDEKIVDAILNHKYNEKVELNDYDIYVKDIKVLQDNFEKNKIIHNEDYTRKDIIEYIKNILFTQQIKAIITPLVSGLSDKF